MESESTSYNLMVPCPKHSISGNLQANQDAGAMAQNRGLFGAGSVLNDLTVLSFPAIGYGQGSPSCSAFPAWQRPPSRVNFLLALTNPSILDSVQWANKLVDVSYHHCSLCGQYKKPFSSSAYIHTVLLAVSKNTISKHELLLQKK